MPIEFPIVDLMSNQSSYKWLLAYFHPMVMGCPHCRAGIEDARKFRHTKSSQVPDYRFRVYGKTYNVYSGTVFEGRRLKLQQVMLLVRGVGKEEQAQILANEVGVCRQTVQTVRRQMQSNAQRMQPDNPLERDEQTETDELYQNVGKRASHISIPMTHPVAGRTSSAGMEPMRTTVRRLSVPLDARAGASVCAWLNILMARRCATMLSNSLKRIVTSIPMNGKVTTMWIVPTIWFVMR